MSPESLAIVKHPHSGTGFLVSIHDDRLPKDQIFVYLVTNRHVAQPGIEKGEPCVVSNYVLLSNSKEATTPTGGVLKVDNLGPSINWVYSDDASVDLAILPISLPPSSDFMTMDLNIFVSQDMLDDHRVVEGDPVLFAGLFIQFHGASKLEPIVRSGTLAMLPYDQLSTTLNKMGRVYLADAHTFGGNSGSPIFVDINKFRGTLGYDYRLLGVIAGSVPETSDFTLQVTTDYKGSVQANSGVCVVVPQEEIRKILNSDTLKHERDQVVANILPKTK